MMHEILAAVGVHVVNRALPPQNGQGLRSLIVSPPPKSRNVSNLDDLACT